MGFQPSLMIYAPGAFLLGLALGWLIWGRLKARGRELEAEISRLTAEHDRLRPELDACGKARAELRAEVAALRERMARPAPAPKPAKPARP